VEKKEIIEQILAEWKAPEGQPLNDSWNQLQQKIGNREKKGKTVSMRTWLLSGVAAAAVVAILFLGPLADSGSVQLVASAVQKEGFDLPDGSLVYLNGGSNVQYEAGGWNMDRVLNLDGEAYFDVIKGSTFSVNTEQGLVTVLGTTFNVLDRGEVFEVECFSGKVSVEIGSQEEILSPGQGVRIVNSTLAVYDLSTTNPDWKLGEFKFVDADAADVFEELEWQLGMDIIVPNLEGYKFTGDFETKDSELALSTVCLALGLQHKINADMSVSVSK